MDAVGPVLGGVALRRRRRVPARPLDRASAYLARWGGDSVVLGRYGVFVRSYLGGLARINRMATGPVLLWTRGGAVVWTLTRPRRR